MDQRQCHAVASRSGQQTATAWPCLRRRLSPYATLQQPVQARVTAQVAAVPAFTDDRRPSRPGSPVQQQQQHNGWLPQPWSSKAHQQQQQQQQQQPQQVAQQSAQQLDQQQHQFQLNGQQPDPWASHLQQCNHWKQVAALVNSHGQERLTFPHVNAVLQQLCSCTQVTGLALQQRQQLDGLLTTLADAAMQQLPDLHHDEVGQLLARFQVLGFRPSVAWVKSVLQHAGTELVHYTPAELALLLLTATQTAARVAGTGQAMQPLQLTRSSPVAGPAAAAVPADAAAAAPADAVAGPAKSAAGSQGSSSAGSSSTGADTSTHPSSTAARRANTVLTSAWLQHFMATFERYLAARTAHPQLQPQHLEAVITCLAALRVMPDRFWLYLFVRQMTAQLPECAPASVVRILSALASMGYRLPDHVISQIERQVGGAALASLRPQECVDVVKSVAVLKHKPSEAWMQQLLAAALKGSSHLSASAVVTLMVCTAALGIDLNPGWIDCLLMQARAALHVLSAPEHVGLIDALSQQQHRPGPVFMSVYMSQVQGHLPELSLGQQAVLIASLAAVGYKPAPAWMAAFMGQLAGQAVTAGDAGELLKLLVALRRMQYVPTSQVAQQVQDLIDSIALNVPYNQLQQLRAALADLQYRPYEAPAAAAAAAAQPVRSRVSAARAAAPMGAAPAATSAAEEQGQQQQEGESVGQGSEQQEEQEDGTVGDKPASVMESLELLA